MISEGPKARHGYQQPPDSFAVFPNASTDPHTPAPYPSQGQHTPPQMNQQMNQGQQTPPPQMHQGPPTPPPQMNYGRPTPPPQNYAPINYQTPPPPAQHMAPAYPQAPQMAPRSGSNWKPLVIFAVIAVVVAVGLLIIIGALTDNNNSDSGDGYSGSGSSSPSPAITMGDPSQTIDPSECTSASDGSTDGTVELPELKFTYIDSVKRCLDAAGWSYREVPTDEHLFGKGMVIDTSPSPFTSFDPKNTKIVLYVSTGKLD